MNNDKMVSHFTLLSCYFAICLNESNGVVVVAYDMIAVDRHLILAS